MRKSANLVFFTAISACFACARIAEANDAHAASPAGASVHAQPSTQPAAQSVSADDAIRRLADGNARYVAQSQQRPNQSADRRHETHAGGQHPFAAVLGCADSRVPVELIFDAGIGDLFVARVAGNVASVDEIGTLEYAVEHLGINAILVMGHTKCGAVTAVVDHAHVTSNIEKLIEPIAPAVEAARKTYPQLSGGRLVEKAVRMNVNQSIASLTARSELLHQRVNAGTLKIVGAVYDLNSGELDWLEPAAVVPQPVAGADAHSSAHHPTNVPVHTSTPDAHSHGTSSAHPADDHHDAAPATQPAAATDKPRRENFVALGGLLAGSGLASCGVIFVLRGKN